MVDNSLNSVLNDKMVTKALSSHSLKKLGSQNRIFAFGDHSDIRKRYSKKLDAIGKVKDLDGKIINGYTVYATILLDEKKQELTFGDITTFSNREKGFVSQEELKNYEKNRVEKDRKKEIESLLEDGELINMKKSVEEHYQGINDSFVSHNKDIKICFVNDRFCDDNSYFKYIDETLKQEFIVRAKKSRNSDKKFRNPDTNRDNYIKLIDLEFANQEDINLQKISIKNKLYEQVKMTIEWDLTTIDEKKFTVIKVTLKDRVGKDIYSNPMVLISNIEVSNLIEAEDIFYTYLKRSKIEAVFKFLKDVLGLEEFQVRDFESIKNIISICFFVGGYFYEIEDILTKNETIQLICKLGNGKGKITRHYFLQGLEVILKAQRFNNFISEYEISKEQIQEMYEYAGI